MNTYWGCIIFIFMSISPEITHADTTSVFDELTQTYVTNSWLEIGYTVLNGNSWTTIQTAVNFVNPAVFISIPTSPNSLSNVWITRIKNLHFEPNGVYSFDAKLYQPQGNFCSTEWFEPYPTISSRVMWMVVEHGVYRFFEKKFIISQGGIAHPSPIRYDSDNLYQIWYPSGCNFDPDYICNFPQESRVGVISQIQSFIYDRYLLVRAYSVAKRFTRFYMTTHALVNENDGIFMEEEILAYFAYESGVTGTCHEGLSFEGLVLSDVTSIPIHHNFTLTYDAAPGTFGFVSSMAGLDPVGVRVYRPSNKDVTIILQEDQCVNSDTAHTNPEIFSLFTIGDASNLNNGVSSSCYLVYNFTATPTPTELPTTLPTEEPSLLPTNIPTLLPSLLPSWNPTELPSFSPTEVPSLNPTSLPSNIPTFDPTSFPSTEPTALPSAAPSVSPTSLPSFSPTELPSTPPTEVPSLDPTSAPSSLPSLSPTTEPSSDPSSLPTSDPSAAPSSHPSHTPTELPSLDPSVAPSLIPTSLPTLLPSLLPSSTPTSIPSTLPTICPTELPSFAPTSPPTSFPSTEPTTPPSEVPSAAPTSLPSIAPTELPTFSPTEVPSLDPTSAPSSLPSLSPTTVPSTSPSEFPSPSPTSVPSFPPTTSPSELPTVIPTAFPSPFPTLTPSSEPTALPSEIPSTFPSELPSFAPSTAPSSLPSLTPTTEPSTSPSTSPTFALPGITPSSQPSTTPTSLPTDPPTSPPSNAPSLAPSAPPSESPTTEPSSFPTLDPTTSPTLVPTLFPSTEPTALPSEVPSVSPTSLPSVSPTSLPSIAPTELPSTPPTEVPSLDPTSAPSSLPSLSPTTEPSSDPSSLPTSDPSVAPSSHPSHTPTDLPSLDPSVAPSLIPTSLPTLLPSLLPSSTPTSIPSTLPTICPTELPSFAPSSPPTSFPSTEPTALPSEFPSAAPTSLPSIAPTEVPTFSPTEVPSLDPTSAPSSLPSNIPTFDPTSLPSTEPTTLPSEAPSVAPTSLPSIAPTELPSLDPTFAPSSLPSLSPTTEPSSDPSSSPTTHPSHTPTDLPSFPPSSIPTSLPTLLLPLLPTSTPTLISSIQFNPTPIPEGWALYDSLCSLKSSFPSLPWNCSLPKTMINITIICSEWSGISCDDNNQLIGLDLPRSLNSSNQNFPDILSSMTTLRYLNLSGNLLDGPLPPSFALLTSLEILDLSFNSFGMSEAALDHRSLLIDSVDELFTILTNLTSLKYLDIHANNLVGYLPSSLCQLQLETLKVRTLEDPSLLQNNFTCVAQCLFDNLSLNLVIEGDLLPVCEFFQNPPTSEPTAKVGAKDFQTDELSSSSLVIILPIIIVLFICICIIIIVVGCRRQDPDAKSEPRLSFNWWTFDLEKWKGDEITIPKNFEETLEAGHSTYGEPYDYSDKDSIQSYQSEADKTINSFFAPPDVVIASSSDSDHENDEEEKVVSSKVISKKSSTDEKKTQRKSPSLKRFVPRLPSSQSSQGMQLEELHVIASRVSTPSIGPPSSPTISERSTSNSDHSPPSRRPSRTVLQPIRSNPEMIIHQRPSLQSVQLARSNSALPRPKPILVGKGDVVDAEHSSEDEEYIISHVASEDSDLDLKSWNREKRTGKTRGTKNSSSINIQEEENEGDKVEKDDELYTRLEITQDKKLEIQNHNNLQIHIQEEQAQQEQQQQHYHQKELQEYQNNNIERENEEHP